MLKKKSITVLMDSLSCYPNKKPFKFASKFRSFPHLKGVICGVGTFNIIVKWWKKVEDSLIVKNITQLDHFTPNLLRNILNEVEEEFNVKPTATIYHFGIDELNNEMIGYVYRSSNSFISEKVGYHIGYRPNYEIYWDKLPKNDNIQAYIEIMKQLKHQDDILKENKVGIGGEIHLLMLELSGQYIGKSIYKFKDYDKNYEEMIDNLQYINQ